GVGRRGGGEGGPAADRREIPVSEPGNGSVVVTGSVAFDYLMTFPERFLDVLVPDRMHRLSVSFRVDDMRRVRGGCAPNIAYSLARLGARPVIMATAGSDARDYRDSLPCARGGGLVLPP